jgi:hypothetical protein
LAGSDQPQEKRHQRRRWSARDHGRHCAVDNEATEPKSLSRLD